MPCGGYVILMSRVKDIRLKVIPSRVANDFVLKHHYSGRVVNTSKLHFGAFLDGVLHGVMSLGSSMMQRNMIPLVDGTKWSEAIELNRMVFDDVLPKYSESRCISVALKLLKKQAPHIKWVVSFADGTQCGDGTIYRASGFKLISVKKNNTLYRLTDGRVVNNLNMTGKYMLSDLRQRLDLSSSWSYNKNAKILGAKKVVGYQLKYIYFLHPEEQKNLTVPIIPFSKIKEMGASMYLGKNCDAGVIRSIPSVQDGGGGAVPTASLNNYA